MKSIPNHRSTQEYILSSVTPTQLRVQKYLLHGGDPF